MASGDWAGRLLLVGLALAIAASAAWLFTAGATTQRMPGDEALGTPAVGSFTAARDYEIVDAEATRRLRAQAAEAERPVYDLDERAAEEAVARIRDAFQLMREAQAERREGRAGGERTRRRTEASAEARKALEVHREAFEERLGLHLGDPDFAALAEARFGEPVEQQLVGLAAHGLSGLVVEDRSRLAEESERGIVVRAVRHGVPRGERILADVGIARDVASARGDVQRSGGTLAPTVPPHLRAAVLHIAGQLVRPTLVLNFAETAARQRDAADRVKPAAVLVRRGEKIVADGERIEKRHLLVFQGIRAQTRAADLLLVRLGGGAVVALLVMLLYRFAMRNVAGFRPGCKDDLLLGISLLATMALTAGGLVLGDALHDRFPRIPPESFYFLVPFSAGALVVRSVLTAEVALLFSVAAGSMVGLLAGHSIFFGLQALLTCLVASGLAPRSRGRAGLFKVGAAVGAIGSALVVSTHLFTGRDLFDALYSAAAAMLSGVALLPLLVVAVLPIVERAFGYLTDVKLLELANLNHPALKDLIVQAPGTYHHSVIMGSLAEAAAQAIGANPLLARVCAYYHDIGKTRNPVLFSENQRTANEHQGLAPSMSALIVKRHVADGLELARQWKLPRAVADAIREHHGTRLVSFFWAMAQQAAGRGEGPWKEAGGLDEDIFRYAGPKPQSREAAIVMMADACEASARALPEPGSERIHALVQKRIKEIFGEGQLDECDLTLRDLDAVASAMARALEVVYRGRGDAGGRGEEDAQGPAARAAAQLHLVPGR